MLALLALALGAAAQLTTTPPQAAPAPISIARALTAPTNDTVTIAGRATAASGQLQANALDLTVDDGTGALRIFSRSVRATVREGDSVVATGMVRTYRGDRELAAIRFTVVPGARRPVHPAMVSLTPAALEQAWGRLVTVRGRVLGYGRSEGGEWLRLGGLAPDDSAHMATIWVGANHGGTLRLEPLRSAERVQVTGIVSAFRDNPEDPLVWQVVPRDGEDLVQLDHRWYDPLGRLLLGGLVMLAAVALGLRIAGRREARELRETEARYRQLLELIPDAVIVYADGKVLFTNPAAARLLDVPDEKALVGRTVIDFVEPETRDALVVPPTPDGSGIGDGATSTTRRRGRMRTASGSTVDVELTASPCQYHDRQATVVLARDITQQLRIERDLESLALLDELTGLHNRRGFTLFAEQELSRARRYGRSAVLVFADLDGLKGINDAHGHSAGDHALRSVARALRSVARESDVVARWAGDEFVALLLEGTDGASDAFHERLTGAIAAQSADLPFAVSATVGTTRVDAGDLTSLMEALGRADSALYKRKQRT